MRHLLDDSAGPGAGLAMNNMPGHWVLARLGKRVLRPGGLELTQELLQALDIRLCDSVVEFAPGLGVTAQMVLERNPAAYTAVERDERAAKNIQSLLRGPRQRCVLGSAESSGLPQRMATVVFGEAMLTMHGPEQKSAIVREAFRLLQPGGRYGIHEICFTEEDLNEQARQQVRKDLAESIRVGARPLTAGEWRALLKEEGFRVKHEIQVPMHLLEPRRVLRDEGLRGASRFGWNLLRDREARSRVLAMRRVFKMHEQRLAAIMLVAIKA